MRTNWIMIGGINKMSKLTKAYIINIANPKKTDKLKLTRLNPGLGRAR